MIKLTADSTQGSHDGHDSDDSSATDSSDHFDWDAEDDTVNNLATVVTTRAKRGRAAWVAFMKLARCVRATLVGVIGAGLLITPFLVFKFHFQNHYAYRHVRAWSLWLSISWAAGVLTYLVVDAIPWLVLHSLRLFGYPVERLRTSVELTAAVSGWLKLTLDVTWLWAVLSIVRASTHTREHYWIIVNRVVQALFSASILLLIEKIFLRYVAINFHRKALSERLAENALGLEALDRLSNAHSPPASKRHLYGHNKRGHISFGSIDLLALAGRSRNNLHRDDPKRGGTAESECAEEKGESSNDGHRTIPLSDSPQKPKVTNEERQKRGRNAIATALIDRVGGVIGQVALKDSKLNQEHRLGSLATAGKLAKKLFSTLSSVDPPRDHLIVDDFVPYFKTVADAKAAFALFDKDGNGDITKREMREAVRRIYRERKALTASLKDVGSAIAKLDAVLVTVVMFPLLFICLLIFNRNNTIASLVPLATIILGFSFVFGHSAQTLFESLIFIFSTHVFDVGDLVVIDDSPMFVKEFGLFSTTFTRVDGAEIIAPNSLLTSSKLVHNLRRSHSMWETTDLHISYDTPLEVIEQLRVRLLEYVAQNSREWSGIAVNIDKMEYQNAITLVIAMEHRPNWQDWGGRWDRRTAFMRNLKTILEDLDVSYTQLVQPVLLPRGGLSASPITLESPRRSRFMAT